ncbi:efflux transporter outer membrane subunit [Uliginosibacterium sp. sgz301328]|uniref:efflux transporter outer membrane subunit n=1 Tax=Uliginosibacterium sp. sgz301328 TaxID=3243764 RepID=UPI00359E4CC0
MTPTLRISIPLIAALLSACTVGPDYVRPDAPISASYKEDPNWKLAEPSDTAPRGAWWEVYGDPVLNGLAAQVAPANQNVAVALAQYRQAQAAVASAESAYSPTVAIDGSMQRSRTTGSSSKAASLGNSDKLSVLDASWVPDLWGQVARSVESSDATAQSNAGTLASVRLAAEAQLVQTYFQLRVTDEFRTLQTNTVEGYERSLQLTQNQRAAGIVSSADVAQAQTQLESARASLIDLDVSRTQYEHAIAILIGKAPANFSLARAPLVVKLPAIPAQLPSQLLERRPDIAAAERKVAAANAQIGVAQAAYYPKLTLSATGGFVGSELANWISLPNRVWAIGGALAETLIDGGARSARVDQARAAYDASVAQYRQTVLGGLQEVEDNLAALRIYAQEYQVQQRAVAAAREAERITLNQYRAGMITYVNVVVAQAATNSNERAAYQLLGRQYTASITLIKALGGGWGGLPQELQQLGSAKGN